MWVQQVLYLKTDTTIIKQALTNCIWELKGANKDFNLK